MSDHEPLHAMLDRLWTTHRDVIQSRICVIEHALEAAQNGRLSAEERTAAEGEAHKLVGALGIFGIAQGMEIAREIEKRLAPTSAISIVDVAAMKAQCSALREIFNTRNSRRA